MSLLMYRVDKLRLTMMYDVLPSSKNIPVGFKIARLVLKTGWKKRL